MEGRPLCRPIIRRTRQSASLQLVSALLRSWWQDAAVFGRFAAHLEIFVGFESYFTDCALSRALFSVVRGHDRNRERAARNQHDADVIANSVQFTRLVCYLNIWWKQPRNETVLRCR